MATDATSGAASGGRVQVRAIRAWWREVHPPPSLAKRLEPVYMVGITVAVLGPFAYGTASSALAQVATPRAVATWGPSLALVGTLALVRWGAVQGPVVFSVPDVAHLLGAPLRRADLVVMRLVRGLILSGAVAAIVAATAIVGIAGHHRGILAAHAVGFAVAAIALGVLGMAGASLVQGSPRWDRATRGASWPILLVAIGLVLASARGGTGRSVALWSGPWGWVVQPVAGVAPGQWLAALGLLVVVTAGVVALAVARRGRCSTERHMLRAEARGGAVASLYSLNSRHVSRSLAGVASGPRAGRGVRLRPPRNPRLAVAWRDAVSALSTPQRLAEAVVLAGGGVVLCLLNAEHPAAVVAGSLAIYLGASRLLEPLRCETDAPSRARVLMPAPMGRVVTEHALVPAFVVLVAAALAAAGCAAAGALPRHGGLAALLIVAATPAITLCAGLSSRRGGQLPASLLSFTTADTSGMSGAIILGWIVVWPLLAAVLGALPVSVVVHRGETALPGLVALLAVAPLGLTAALGWERFAP